MKQSNDIIIQSTNANSFVSCTIFYVLCDDKGFNYGIPCVNEEALRSRESKMRTECTYTSTDKRT